MTEIKPSKQKYNTKKISPKHDSLEGSEEYLEQFLVFIRSDFYSAEISEVKDWVSYLGSMGEHLELFENMPHLDDFLYYCIARSDIYLKNLFLYFISPNHELLLDLFPIILWVLFSQSSKRYLEPSIVDLYESLRVEYKQSFDKISYLKPFQRFTHQPIIREEKEEMIVLMFAVYAVNIYERSNKSKETYLALLSNMCTGMYNPPFSPYDFSDLQAEHSVIQAQLSPKLLKIVIFSLTSLENDFANERNEVMRKLYDYSVQHVFCEITLIIEDFFN